ncbi:flagellar basal body-associated FliL family protein [Cohnella herbarum]|uniref:Flagellar protein FliL n=1 Tax=Cohnella herbarum TaxID=2728023 RepID=A0A7Z2VHW1_9BACL|nr:flagellar basal body-associated FliL family protein [Cohnella herbarum]QJD83372.1 flagellar basal body protein FliL [Cohnella herbarum]
MRKLLPWLVSLLLAITLIVIATFYFWNNLFGDKKASDPDQVAKEVAGTVQIEPISADEMVKVTSELIDIRTNLADTDYVVQISFSFQFDNEKAKEEFDKIKENQVKPIVNRALWVMTPEEMNGTKGKDQLTAGLINSINEVLSDGKLLKVGIKGFVMTPI